MRELYYEKVHQKMFPCFFFSVSVFSCFLFPCSIYCFLFQLSRFKEQNFPLMDCQSRNFLSQIIQNFPLTNFTVCSKSGLSSFLNSFRRRLSIGLRNHNSPRNNRRSHFCCFRISCRLFPKVREPRL